MYISCRKNHDGSSDQVHKQQAGWVVLSLIHIKLWSNYKWNKTWKFGYTIHKSAESNMQYHHNDPSWNVSSSRENMAANGPTSAQQYRHRPSIGQKKIRHLGHAISTKKKSIAKHTCDSYITIYTSNIINKLVRYRNDITSLQSSRQMAWQLMIPVKKVHI